jgi:hypothetical protein
LRQCDVGLPDCKNENSRAAACVVRDAERDGAQIAPMRRGFARLLQYRAKLTMIISEYVIIARTSKTNTACSRVNSFNHLDQSPIAANQFAKPLRISRPTRLLIAEFGERDGCFERGQ